MHPAVFILHYIMYTAYSTPLNNVHSVHPEKKQKTKEAIGEQIPNATIQVEIYTLPLLFHTDSQNLASRPPSPCLRFTVRIKSQVPEKKRVAEILLFSLPQPPSLRVRERATLKEQKSISSKAWIYNHFTGYDLVQTSMIAMFMHCAEKWQYNANTPSLKGHHREFFTHQVACKLFTIHIQAGNLIGSNRGWGTPAARLKKLNRAKTAFLGSDDQ